MFIYLAAPGLRCGTRDLHCGMQDLLVAAGGLLVAACRDLVPRPGTTQAPCIGSAVLTAGPPGKPLEALLKSEIEWNMSIQRVALCVYVCACVRACTCVRVYIIYIL